MSLPVPSVHKAVRLHPVDLTIHVEEISAPKIEHPDDAIVKVKLSGLCGSDLHGYRGHEKIADIIVTGHEFVGEVVALGSSFTSEAISRPPLYSTLQLGDEVVCPFSTSCGECQFCRIGFTSRCETQLLFGSTTLAGAQAQYVRVPKAGGTLFVLGNKKSGISSFHGLSEASLLLLADILPTGVFAALQALQHPNILPVIRGERYPLASAGGLSCAPDNDYYRLEELLTDIHWPAMKGDDRILNIAIIGLGPVGVCAMIALLDLTSRLKVHTCLFVVDLVQSRRENISKVYYQLPLSVRGMSKLFVGDVDAIEGIVKKETTDVGCNAVLEIVGHASALRLAYTLIRPFGVIASVGVHQEPPIPFTGRELYAKNVAMVFGRCPVRTIFPLAADLLRRRQDVFGEKGCAGVERVLSIDDAPEAYRKFAANEWGKIAFDPFK